MNSGGKSNKFPRVPDNFDTESRPRGKQLAKARDVYKDDILRSVAAYKNPQECFKALVGHRQGGCLQKKDIWFLFRNSYFTDDDTKFFTRFVRSRA